jgi:hypothetical protein
MKKETKDKNAKVGGSKKAAKEFGGKHDFGIPAKEATVANDDPYGRVKGPEKGTGPTRSGDADDDRTTGVGAPTGPPGAGSGGDLDPDFIGLDGSGGVSQKGPDQGDGAGEE